MSTVDTVRWPTSPSEPIEPPSSILVLLSDAGSGYVLPMLFESPADQPPIVVYRRREISAAWALHVVTGFGVIVGYIGLNSVIEGHARAAILWLVAALVLDGVDGPIARRLDVGARVPVLDGHALDLIVDYFTCTIVPVAFLYRFDVLPDKIGGPVGFAILLVSALWMSRTDQETADGWFRGFPAEWNMIIPTLYLVHANRWVSLVVCLAFCAFTLSGIEFPHPVSVRRQRGISLAFLAAWLGSMVWLAIAQRVVAPVRVVLVLAPLWTFVQVVQRLIRRREVEVSPDALAP